MVLLVITSVNVRNQRLICKYLHPGTRVGGIKKAPNIGAFVFNLFLPGHAAGSAGGGSVFEVEARLLKRTANIFLSSSSPLPLRATWRNA